MSFRCLFKPVGLCLFLLLAVVALWTGGCATAEPDNLSERPWNAPKGWETGLPMGLNEGR